MEWAYLVGLSFSVATLLLAYLGWRGTSSRNFRDELQLTRAERDEAKAEVRRLRDENQWLRDRMLEAERRQRRDP